MYHKDASGLLTTNQHSNSKHSWSLDWTITWQQLVSLWEGILRINETTNSFCWLFTEIRRNQVIRASWFCNVVILVARRYWKAYAVLPLMIIEFISRDSCRQGNPGWIQEEYFGIVWKFCRTSDKLEVNAARDARLLLSPDVDHKVKCCEPCLDKLKVWRTSCATQCHLEVVPTSAFRKLVW